MTDPKARLLGWMWVLIIYEILAVCGCQTITVHPTESHIYYVPAGITLETINHGTVTTEHPGVWFSEWYMEQIWEVKKEQARE